MAEADSDLTVSVTAPDSATVVLHVCGDVDMVTAAVLAEHVRQQQGTSIGTLVVDLSEVTFLGSAGLAVLAEAHDACRDRGVELRVVATSRMVLRPLQVTGLDTLLTIVTD
ncbi:MAG TPA: STAS domain-containing protein [Pseudonocardiaceae bacterium]|nr:STAS domain-containing protein [Pseudonocardiaceae bacterium]